MKKPKFQLSFYVPSSFLAFVIMLLVVHNGLVVFYVRPPVATLIPSQKLTSESVVEPLAMHAATEEIGSSKPKNSTVESFLTPAKEQARTIRRKRIVSRALCLSQKSKVFSTRLSLFLRTCKCRDRFFMTWLSSLEAFGSREIFAMEGLFKSHPTACLIIISNSLDSGKGNHILLPFIHNGYRVMAFKPHFDYLFSNTPAGLWFKKLKRGKINPGIVSLNQNLSNLLRLAILYKFGGTYLDTDVVVLKNFYQLRNAIGAQTVDIETGNWSRLNNAVLIFDKKHPLLFKFIQEFAQTFDGNKWGHNGPYLVSRVVSRVRGNPEFSNVTILPPSAFYPVNWRRVQSIFKRPSEELHYKWQKKMLERIRDKSFAIHLWNKQSKDIEIEGGSIVGRIMSDYCVLCSFSNATLVRV